MGKDLLLCLVPGCNRGWLAGALLAVAAVLTVACDKVPLLAPTASTITVSAPTRVLPSGGSTEISAYVIEQSGTPVQNGTTVRFSATLGRVDPVEAQTRGGLALTTFFAENSSGIAEVRATSGGATGAAGGTGSTGPGANVVQITIGAAAVEVVTLRANPASVGPSGGTVELIATVVGGPAGSMGSGQPLSGVVVTFGADQGSLSSSTATTNASGEARTTLTTSEKTIASAVAGTKPKAEATITVRPGPIVSIECTPSSAGSTCGGVQASAINNTASVIFTVTKPTVSSALRTATIDFGDGTSQSLGNLAGGSAKVTHTYAGPSGSSPQAYTATVQVTDINGESASTSTNVIVTPKPIPSPINVTITTGTPGPPTAAGQLWSFTVTVTGGGEGTTNAPIESYAWDFGDGASATTSGNTTAHVYDTAATEQRRTVTVTVRTQDGRTASGQTSLIVAPRPPTSITVGLTATGPTTLAQLSAVWTFTAVVSGGGEGGSPISYEWIFGDTVPAVTTTTIPNTISHTYMRASVADPISVPRTVKVTVTTQDGRTAVATRAILVVYAP